MPLLKSQTELLSSNSWPGSWLNLSQLIAIELIELIDVRFNVNLEAIRSFPKNISSLESLKFRYVLKVSKVWKP